VGKPKEWIIEQGDLYWRAGSKGYTRHLSQAGLYTEATAKNIEKNNREPRDVASHILDHSESIKEDYRYARRMLEALKRAVKRKETTDG
jgi:hypothetical protein